MNETLITIPRSEYEEMLEDSEKLASLEAFGVSNWCKYDEAIKNSRKRVSKIKKVVHFKFDMNDVTYEQLNNLVSVAQENLPDYIVIASPFDATFENENDIALCLNGTSYTHKELEEIFDKAWAYDDLSI